MKTTFYLFAFILFNLCVHAQVADYKFLHVTNNEGLSHNQVNSLLKDSKGFLWVGTQTGLNRFDGYSIRTFRNNPHDSTSLPFNDIGNLFETPDGDIGVTSFAQLFLFNTTKERFTTNITAFQKKYQLPDDLLIDISRDSQNNYWFVHSTQGIVYHNATEKKSTSLRHNKNYLNSIGSDSVRDIAHGKNGTTWIIHASGLVEQIQMENGKLRVIYRSDALTQINKGELLEYRVQVDDDGDLWMFVMNGTQGVYYLNAVTKQLKSIQQGTKGQLNVNIIRGIVQDNAGMIWVGTDHGGINVINKKDFSIHYILNKEEDPKSLAQNSITALLKDADGIIWIGTYKKGISYYHELINRFPLYKHSLLNKGSLPYEDVNRFVEDEHANLWIGTNGGGLIYFDRQKNTYSQYLHEPANPNSISSNVIVSMFIDHEKKLWIGTYYGGLNSFDGKRFTRYTHNPSDPSSISDQNVWEIFEDSKQRLWVGTLSKGLDLFDRKTNSFTHYKPGDANSVQARYISAIAEDKEGNVWFGSDFGLSILEHETGRFVFHVADKNDQNTISSNSVLDIHTDTKGRTWIGTHGGLNYFDAATNKFHHFTEEDGLPHNSILTIEEADGKLWLGTPNGISCATITQTDKGLTVSFRNYDETDGLQGKQFNENASYKTRKGELIFGGANGFNIFKPSELQLNQHVPNVVMTDFQLFSKSIKPLEKINGKEILNQSITILPHIVLPPGQNVFAIEFAALNFIHAEKNEYQYKLIGFQNDWLRVDNKLRKVSFTNLDPGEYVFQVRASNNDGVWNEKPTSLQITVLPPFWKTKTAFVLYMLSVLLALFITRKLIQQRERLKFSIQQERQEAIRMHELDMMKIKFFTNVSHEFRTPLTLILTPLEKLLKQATGDDQKRQFELIQRNGKRLLNLVNQLLDFRRMEVQELKFNPSEGDVLKFIKETVNSFSDLSEKKNIRLEFNSTVESLEAIFDQDKLEKILFNLLSNAFKFTQEPGLVSVSVTLINISGNQLEIKVRDTGIGIPPDKQDKIFERFFQHDLPTTMVNQGSGIGLSITHEFVKIHGGTITVESEVGKGSCFTVTLPLHEIKDKPVEQAVITDVVNESEIIIPDEAPEDTQSIEKRKPVLLLVEDNEDFRFYLKDNLKLQYVILEAKDGQEGLKKALSDFPDLIVSDVMMPVMNGIDLCKKIKADQRLSHIPVILLTARSSEEQRLEGFETGADDYINKPFNFEILESRIRNLIAQREKLHKVLSRQMGIKSSELTITSLDEKFIQKAVKYVEEHIAEPEFSVEDLSRELGISRAHFYKKIMALTGKSPLEFIRTIRLQHAAQLLEKSQLTVAEVAYQVGFNNPKYFARYFKETYHVLPSAYASGKRRDR